MTRPTKFSGSTLSEAETSISNFYAAVSKAQALGFFKGHHGPFVRNDYFAGRFLSADDFERESNYHREKRWLINRSILGWGVVGGLNVVADSNLSQLVVTPGFAIDGWGREILVPEPVTLTIPKQPLPSKGKKNRKIPIHLRISYLESKEAPVVAPDGQTEPSLIREGFEFRFEKAPQPAVPFHDPQSCKGFPKKKVSYLSLVNCSALRKFELPKDPSIPLANISIFVPKNSSKPNRIAADISIRPLVLS